MGRGGGHGVAVHQRCDQAAVDETLQPDVFRRGVKFSDGAIAVAITFELQAFRVARAATVADLEGLGIFVLDGLAGCHVSFLVCHACARALPIAAISAGVMRQQPPMMRAPAASHSRAALP